MHARVYSKLIFDESSRFIVNPARWGAGFHLKPVNYPD